MFEGGDGVGKSTQLSLLCDWLEARGERVVRTFEPGDTAVGQQIRRLVLDPATGELSARAEALLYAADKAQHVDTVVRPALQSRGGGGLGPVRRLDDRLPGRRPGDEPGGGRRGGALGHRRPAIRI